jgi:hypothetical protein
MFGALTALPGKNRSHSVQVRSTNLNLTEVSAFLYRHFLKLSRYVSLWLVSKASGGIFQGNFIHLSQ